MNVLVGISRHLSLTLLAVVSLLALSCGAVVPRPRWPQFLPTTSSGAEAPKAEEKWFSQPVDHLSPSPSSFRQRFFLNDEHYVPGGPMFFYLGNEADVTLYVNATGLMWENAPAFGALVIFAEHRYYGSSLPFGEEDLSPENLRFLSSEQAILDYVALIAHLKEEYSFAPEDAVVGFGGSYGGMLASWARFKYPEVWDGAIAASAPIVSFEGMEDGAVDPNFYAEGVTYDVTAKGKSAPNCEVNLRKAFEKTALVDLPSDQITRGLRLCKDQNSDQDGGSIGWAATQWLSEALSYMAMGNYPYPSKYILNGDGTLPAFPVREGEQQASERSEAA